METQTLRRRIAQIENMDLAELKTKWVELFGTPSPKGMSAKLLRRAGINQVQVGELGGLKPETIRALGQALNEPKTKATSLSGFAIGTRFIRQWHGRTYVVEVVQQGFNIDGETYNSLSALARHITGTRWNGRRFFGVASGKPNGAKP